MLDARRSNIPQEGSRTKGLYEKLYGPNIKEETLEKTNGYNLRQVEQNMSNQRAIRMSSASPEINIYKNLQTAEIIASVSKNSFNKVEQRQIEECMRQFNIDFRTLVKFTRIFMDADVKNCGFVSIGDMVDHLIEAKQILPMPVFNFLTSAIRVNKVQNLQQTSTQRASTGELLSLAKLHSVVEVFNRCPMLTQGSSNNSNNFKNIVQLPGFVVTDD